MIGLEKEYYPEIRGSVLAAGTLSLIWQSGFCCPRRSMC